MQKLDEIFVAKNKRALLEEIGIQIEKGQNLISVASVSPGAEAAQAVLCGLSNVIGSLDFLYKQYIILRSGEISPFSRIGFGAFDKEDTDPSKEDKEDSETTS